MKIEKRQQKILIMAGIAFSAILVFWLFIYSPKKKQMKELKFELYETRKVVSNFKKIVGEEESLDVAIDRYNTKLKDFKLKLPSQEESTIRDLATEANKLGIEVLAITPGSAVNSKLPINVKGYTCRELPISINLKTQYRKFADYIVVLKERFPAILVFNKLDIRREREDVIGSLVVVTLDVTLYLMIPQSAS